LSRSAALLCPLRQVVKYQVRGLTSRLHINDM